jgi:Cu(I)/Ag(I) efflux system membrane fusion protein
LLAPELFDYNQLIQSAKNRLLLWGMTEGQIKALADGQEAGTITSFYGNAEGTITEINIK